MNRLVGNILKDFVGTWEYKTILLYLFMGSMVFVNQSLTEPYWNIFLGSFTKKTFLIVILFASFLAMFVFIYRQIINNQPLLLRLSSKKNFVIFCLLMLVVSSAFLFAQAIIIQLICCNLRPHLGYSLTMVKYDANSYFIMIIALLKVFFTILSIGLLYLVCYFSFKKKNISIFVSLAFLFLLYFGDRVFSESNFLFVAFNPGYQAYGFYLTNQISTFILSGLVYFGLVFGIFSILLFYKAKKKDLGMDEVI